MKKIVIIIISSFIFNSYIYSLTKYVWSGGSNIAPFTNLSMAAISLNNLVDSGINNDDEIIICDNQILTNSINQTNKNFSLIGSNIYTYGNSINIIYDDNYSFYTNISINSYLIQANNLLLKNINIFNISTIPGLINCKTNLYIINSTISNCFTLMNNEFIRANNLYIYDSIFKNNYSFNNTAASKYWLISYSNLIISNTIIDKLSHIDETASAKHYGTICKPTLCTNFIIYNSKFLNNYSFYGTINLFNNTTNQINCIIDKCIFISNCSYNSGADIYGNSIVLTNNSKIKIINCSFSNKSHIYSSRAKLYYNGISILDDNSEFIIDKCLIKDASDLDRSIVFGNNVNNIIIQNSLIIGSTAGGGGVNYAAGGIYISGNNNKIINCTIANNSSIRPTSLPGSYRTGGILLLGTNNYIINSIIYSNYCNNKINSNHTDNLLLIPIESNYVFSSISPNLSNNNYNIINCYTDYPEIINFDSKIGFGLSNNYNYHLKNISIAINNGIIDNTNNINYYFDLDNRSRLNFNFGLDTNIDIGCYEFKINSNRPTYIIELYNINNRKIYINKTNTNNFIFGIKNIIEK